MLLLRKSLLVLTYLDEINNPIPFLLRSATSRLNYGPKDIDLYNPIPFCTLFIVIRRQKQKQKKRDIDLNNHILQFFFFISTLISNVLLHSDVVADRTRIFLYFNLVILWNDDP